MLRIPEELCWHRTRSEILQYLSLHSASTLAVPSNLIVEHGLDIDTVWPGAVQTMQHSPDGNAADALAVN